MTRLSHAFLLLGVAGSLVVGQEFDQEKQNKDAACNNGCFFEYFTNKCNDDNPACVCTLKDMREKFFCCIAKKCDSDVLPDQIQRSSDNCDAYKLPFTFDAGAVCGIKLSKSNTLTGATATTSEASTATLSKSHSVSTTEGASPTQSSAASKTSSAAAELIEENSALRVHVAWSAVIVPILFGLFV
ncbi:hypothetical protein FHETE_9103 [Fusarium heterosporum]|uniref:Extracellular membrane protein CFEM domain-containing protein n=1 Tax=Fusarium heterosporum TaxID=42747 RepID=A0A8H5SW46_FUSHE|nr:hypothetical protein FHETE_9103 [Fusarium heterosporum]